MAKTPQPSKQLPASEPGAVPPDPEPTEQVSDPALEAPETTTPDPAPESPAPVAEEPAAAEPEPTDVPEPPAADPEPRTLRCRVNWHFTGFREQELQEGDEVTTTEAEAAPFLGGVLTRLPDEDD